MPDPAPALPAACLNCEQAFGAPRPRYCPACGQETNVRPPRLGEFVQQFGGSYIALEGALWRSLKLLLFKPGAITREYLDGRRRRYVLPLRLYLTISVIVLLAMRALASAELQVGRVDGPGTAVVVEDTRNFDIRLGPGMAGLKDGVFFCRDLPGWLCQRLQRRLDIDPKAIRQEAAAWGERFLANIGAALFVLVPGFAFWLQLAYLNRRLRYPEHLVFALHVHAFWFLMLALMLVKLPLIEGLAFFATPVYTLLAMRRVYGGRWWPLLARAAFVCALYGATLAIALTGVALWALLF